jgi:glycosyltransferase involved in cell wall biosynthesis
MKLVVFSICQNEGKTVGELIDRIPKRIEGVDEIEIFIVDDGSTDNTVEESKKRGVKVFSNNSIKKLAYSFQFAVNKSLELGADVVVNIDGDLQFSPEEIPLLVKPIIEGKADFVAGNRFVDPKTNTQRKPDFMSQAKYWGNKMGAYVVSRLAKENFQDVTCGFRAYNREALLHMNINNKFTYTQEAFQLMASKQLNIVQVPISIKYFKGRKSRVVSSIFSFISVSALNIVRVFRDFAPMKFFGMLGFFPFMLGLICIIFMGIHWLTTGDFSPYKFVGFTGLYLLTFGLLIWLVGVFADILGRIINNQEKILYMTKKNYYSKFNKKK